ncbi:MAG: bifunctional diaminohydroxyphosphoribosylaminopyrimidine deaminase/5-amino-6-(5-phosphoribosylamino)uracil reductase RibD, partial [Leadbetterella sp.]|nr:bifunctional diaminohydroxyphosphoribosylaminopyrimidine deaminase/5-amino-6-(5-phosphoribosylamino)uracil reductase RibD [Leadbetterella sp.]
CNDTVIGEGFHQKYGEAHAEVNAIQSVADKALLPASTVFVTLEPCSHHGKTPPCTDLLIQYGVKEVVICNQDPFPRVSGRGIARLEAAGIKVKTGLLAEKGEELNKRFFKVHRTGLPYIILKWAETADGLIANPDGSPVKISNPVTDITVHRWRAEEDAVLVGKNTVLNDNPRLNVRHWTENKQPVRVVLASSLEKDPEKHIFDNTQKTLIYHHNVSKTENNTEYIRASGLTDVLRSLKEKGINSVLVEGGRKTHESFISQRLFDEIRVIKSSMQLGKGISAPQLPPGILLEKNIRILNDQLFFYRNIPTF